MAGAARVFFALWPSPVLAATIDACARAQSLDGRRVTRERLHLTLAFHGACDVPTIAALENRARAVTAAPFEFVLDRIGGFARSRVAWIAPSSVPSALIDLAAALAAKHDDARDCRPFRPHVTLARNVSRAPAGRVAPIRWPVDGFALVASGDDGAPGAYRTLARWTLGGCPLPRVVK